MATERAHLRGAARRWPLRLLVATILCTSATAAQTDKATTWYRSVSATETAVACMTMAEGRPSRARVSVVDRKGHICDVSGPLTAGAAAGKWNLHASGGCELSLSIERRTLAVHDAGSCQPKWCGAGVTFGDRRLAAKMTPVRPTCEEP